MRALLASAGQSVVDDDVWHEGLRQYVTGDYQRPLAMLALLSSAD